MEDVRADKMTYQLCDVGHLGHVVQSVFRGLLQHDGAGGHNAQLPERLHVGLDVTVAVCWSERCQCFMKESLCTQLDYTTFYIQSCKHMAVLVFVVFE